MEQSSITLIFQGIITIISFILGCIVSNIIFNKKEKEKLKRVINFFECYWVNQINAINKQVDFIKMLNDEVSNLKNTNGVNISIVSQPYAIFDSINKEDLLSAWTKIKTNDPQSLIDKIKFVEFTKESFLSLKNYHNGFISRQADIRTVWNDKINEFTKYKDKLLNVPSEELSKNPHLIKLNQIYKDWCRIENYSNICNTIKYLENPLYNHFKYIHSCDQSDQIAFELLTYANDINIQYKIWEGEINAYSIYLTNLLKLLEKEIKQIS